MRKKTIIFSAIILMLLFVLAACKPSEGPVVLIGINNPTQKLVYQEGESPVFQGENGLSYWKINGGSGSNAGRISQVSYQENFPSYDSEDTNGVRTYTLSVDGITDTFQFYYKPDDVPAEATEIVMIAFRYQSGNLLYHRGQTFDATGLEIHIVRRNGAVEVLKGEDYQENFTTDFEPLGENGFVNHQTYDVTFTFEGVEKEFSVYIGGGEKPIHSGDAGFFDYILFIPVSFILQLFAGIMGNSFALGILFTTIVIRSLAWPIYAKSNDMSIKMALAQPDMQRVQNKYATRRDPQAKQQQQMEMFQVYKKHNISLLGCFVPLLQMPIFIAMYNSVRRVTLEGGMYVDKVSNTMFLGFDLSRGNDGVRGMILAGIVGVTMALLQYISTKKPSYAKNTTKHNQNAQQAQTEKTMKMVSYFMVIMMVVFSYQSNAIAIYWIFGNIYSLGQTLLNRKLNERKHARLQEKQILG